MERLFVYLTSDLTSASAYWIIFGILVACGLGFPLPEDIPLIASGYLSWKGTLNVGIALAVTMAGVGIGDTFLYLIGRKLGPSILDSKGLQAFFKPKRIQKTRDLFGKYGDKIVFFARFVAGIRAIAFFSAGALRMPFTRFITFDMLAALLSVPLWIALGYALGHYWGNQIEQILQEIEHYKSIITWGILATLAIVILRYYFKFKQAQRLQKAETPDSK